MGFLEVIDIEEAQKVNCRVVNTCLNLRGGGMIFFNRKKTNRLVLHHDHGYSQLIIITYLPLPTLIFSLWASNDSNLRSRMSSVFAFVR